jgi:hypothetical protein
MPVTTHRLGQAAGIAAVVAGAIYVLVQINHPPMSGASVQETDWLVRSTAKTVMSALALAGFTGMYLRQRRQVGVFGLVGYLVLCTGYLALFATTFVAAFVLPTVALTSPEYVDDIVVAVAGGTPTGDIGLMQVVFAVTGAGYIGGGLLFGIATFRAGVLARWAALLLAVGTVSTAALAVLPESFNRPAAVPVGLALMGLGASLWRDQRRSSTESAQVSPTVAPLVPTPVR